MKAGFFSKHPVNAEFVNGDAILSKQLIKGIKAKFSDFEGYVFGPDVLPDPNDHFDFILWLGDYVDERFWNNATKNIFYLQSGLITNRIIQTCETYNFDGILSYSLTAMETYKHLWKDIPQMYLPLCVDTTVYYPPKDCDEDLQYDVSYCGGSWKDNYLYEKYIIPACKYNFGLYGSWKEEKRREKERKQAICSIFKKIFRLNFGKKFFQSIESLKPNVIDELYPKCKGIMPSDKIKDLYANSKINLNFACELMLKDDTITGRVFEILACKGFCITDKTPYAQEVLKDCVVFTDGGKQLDEQIDYWLKPERKKERKKVAENGYNWVIKNVSHEVIGEKLYNYLKEMEC